MLVGGASYGDRATGGRVSPGSEDEDDDGGDTSPLLSLVAVVVGAGTPETSLGLTQVDVILAHRNLIV